MQSFPRPLAALALGLALTSGSCVGFHREWQRARELNPAPQRGIEGAWSGSWLSGANGHHGGLRCIVERTGDGRYEFYYWATWARVLSGGFRIEVAVEEDGGKWSFSGEKDLGKLGGAFTHEGTATPERIEARFESERGDHGTFQLTRPGEGGAE